MFKPVPVFVGGDPELFFKKDGNIIGAEKVIPAEGLKSKYNYKPSVVLDGIQVELNPAANQNVVSFGVNIKECFQLIKGQLSGQPGVSCEFAGLVSVTQEEIDSLSPKARILGCKPSKNVYGFRPITVDPLVYLKRSAGGHQHFGLVGYRNLFINRVDLIALNDIFVGNTMVLLDRDPGAAERRENYGRAGEYREPDYGIEYRALSNVWLRSYALTDLVFGLAQISISCLDQPELMAQLIQTVDIDRFVDAINKNDWNLAKENFDDLRPFLSENLPKEGMVLNEKSLDRFVTFAEGVRDKGIEYFFGDDPIKSWTEQPLEGFESFLKRIY